MGGFVYAGKRQNAEDAHGSDLAAMRRVFEVKGLPLKASFETDAFTVHLFDKHSRAVESFVTFANDDFALATGTLIYRNRVGPEALELLHRDLPSPDLLSNASGHFFALVCKNGKLSAFGDHQGLYHVFSNADQSVVSNSFLAVAKTLSIRNVSQTELYEMLLYGATYGRRTLLCGVDMLAPRRLYSLSPKAQPTELEFKSEDWPTEVDGQIDSAAEALTKYFVSLKRLFGNEVCAALSGGFDSRLLLASMRKVGIEPQLYVYGSDGSADVRVAKAICAGEGLPLEHIDKSDFQDVDVDQWEDSFRETFYFFDGKGENAVDSGSDLATRRLRSARADLQLNGGGGEVLRNFWKLPDRSYSIDQFVRARRGTIDTRLLTSRFDDRDFFSSLVGKHLEAIELEPGVRPKRDQLETLYPRLRMRYWMGQNNSANNQHGYALTPLAEPIFTIPSARIPLKNKNLGRFEAALIERMDPVLARYPSAYGFDFASQPGLARRLKNELTLRVPVPLRGPLRQIQQRYLSREEWPFYLRGDYFERIFGDRPLEMSRYIDVEGIRNVGLLKRVLAIELLLTDRF